jgi:DNA-binding NarL/FixJ family response regulator
MRVVLVGPAAARARLHALLDDASIGVVGEFPTIGSATAAGLDADGILIAPNAPPADDDAGAVEALTAREIQVLELLAEGLSNKAIAGRLQISDQTVKFHVAAIAGKLGAANRTDAVRRAVRRGLIAL